MSGSIATTTPPGALAVQFGASADEAGPPPPAGRAKGPAPFSLRLSAAERARLDEMAGGQALGAYVRARLFGEGVRPRRSLRRPGLDHQKLALVLAELGNSRLAANMNQIAKGLNMGSLQASPGLALDLEQACRDIRRMRDLLIAALGLREGG